MPEELTGDTPADESRNEAATAVAEPEGQGEEAGEKKPAKLEQQVTMTDAGPCKKHVRVVIARKNIDDRINEKFSTMRTEAQVPGYRPGKAPRKLIEKRFYKEVTEQLKGELLLQSLEQLAEDNKLNPISQPNIDPFKIEIPKEGDLVYEFEVEVAPEFELPAYKGLTIKRPVREITDADVAKAQQELLRRDGTLRAKDGPAEKDDLIVCDLVVNLDGQATRRFEKTAIRLEDELVFQDGKIDDFLEKMRGVRAGESRTLTIHLSPNLSNPRLRGADVQCTFNVDEVREVVPPELTQDYLDSLGVHNEEQLKERIRMILQNRQEYEQRQAAREQVLATIAAAASWELPDELVRRQAHKTLQKKVMELRKAGFGDEEIRSRINLLQHDAVASTIKSLKEHFVLQKIAEVENLDVTDDDVDFEVEMIAEQTGESPRKVRARLEREDLLEALMNQIIERKALDLVLEHATYEDVAMEPEKPMAAVEGQMIPEEPAAESPPAASETGSAAGS